MASDRDGFTLLVTPPPTPNGPLHLGHLSGPYLAGDVAARAGRASGRDLVTLCGLDSHQNYVLARAKAMGQPAHQTADHFADLIRRALAAARVEYDIFIDPLADADYRAGVAGLMTELVAAKAIVVDETSLPVCSACDRTLNHVWVSGSCPACGSGAAGGTCEECGSFLTAGNLVDATSSCCQAPPRFVSMRLPVLRLEDSRQQLTGLWSRAVLPARVSDLTGRYLSAGLPEVLLGYPTDWGIEWRHGDDEFRIDVWAEMALGYLYVVAKRVNPDARTLSECLTAWGQVREIWHFLGIDNAFYYSTLIPALLMAAGLPDDILGGLVVNEFYRLDGLKFSTSRDHAIWAHEFLPDADAGVVRAYLSWSRPDVHGTDFTMSDFKDFTAHCQAVLDGGAVAALSPGLARQEIERARRALRLESFDVGLAVRCALAAHPTLPGPAGAVLDHITAASSSGNGPAPADGNRGS